MNISKEEYLSKINEVIENGRFKDDWASLSRHQTPRWYADAKFGIFIHWGIYSVPAYHNEWYSREMYDKTKQSYRHHIKTYGNQKDFGYKDFIPMFKGEKFNAAEWVDVFKKSGARYVMPVSEHHDGFVMYNTSFNRWNSVQMGPKRDVVGEIKAACDDAGLAFCASNHRAEHFFFMNMGKTIESDVNDEKYADFYGPAYYCDELGSMKMGAATADIYSVSPDKEFLDDWLVRVCEFIDDYKPHVLYFDWWIHNKAFKPYLKKIAAYYYNRAEEWGAEVTINYKKQAFAPGTATLDVERGALVGISPETWQTCTAIGKRSWGYTADNQFKSAEQIICDLVDIVSKNGNMLLNVGPRSDGTLTERETAVLLEIGKWLSANGEGIYGTVPWLKFGEGKVNAKEGFFRDNKKKPFTKKDFRFTYKNGCVYAFQMKPSKSGVVKIKSFKKIKEDLIINKVSLLGSGEELDFSRDEKEMKIYLKNKSNGNLPICFKLEIG